jgi:dTDP-4-amino-4,6-dideoxygalactose transaminase
MSDAWTRTKSLGSQMLLDPLQIRWNSLRGAPARSETPVPAVRSSAADAYPYNAAASSWRMPRSAAAILNSADLNAVVESRRQNFAVLASKLTATQGLTPVRRQLQPDDCPWGFPVLLPNRAEKDYIMRARGVPLFTFGEVLHPALAEGHAGEARMLDTVRYLSDSMLAFVIHQQLDRKDIAGYADTIHATLSGG